MRGAAAGTRPGRRIVPLIVLGSRDDRVLRITLHAADGRPLWSRATAARELRRP